MNAKTIDPLFDGHLEKPLTKMNAEEKLLYLSMQIELRYEIAHTVKRIGPISKLPPASE